MSHGTVSTVAIRIVLAEDNSLLREGIRSLIEAQKGLELVGIADDYDSLLGLVEAEPNCRASGLCAQPSLFDPTRAPAGKHTFWAYCHVPHASTLDMTAAVETQIERFAPGFRDRVVARHVMGTRELEVHNANYVGGDIAGGSHGGRQLLLRPVTRLDSYRVPTQGPDRWFLCSASTPPGAGVHGMCGLWAARSALRHL